VVDVVDMPFAASRRSSRYLIALTKSSAAASFPFRGRLIELAVDAEAADLAEPVAVGVEEFLVEQLAGLFQLRRVARPQPLVDLQQRLLRGWWWCLRQRC
jgi:hypothetical protein